MELSKTDIKILKGVAILFMVLLHLFCRKDVNGLYETFPLINGVPFIYYLALFGDACVPIYCFSSGYGLFTSFRGTGSDINKNLVRIFKLLVNYWIVLILFVTAGFIAGKTAFPGSITKFILNFFVLSSSYNGAWWFMQTYILLVLMAPWLVKLIKNYSSVSMLLISGIIYMLSYIQRIRHVFDFDNNVIISILVNSVVLVGTSQLAFIVGGIFAKEKIYSKLYYRFYKLPFKNILCLIGIIGLFMIHFLYESMVIAPITAIAFICFFNLMDKSAVIQKTLTFFGEHSTNIWLTHMFFYSSIFPELIFAPRYPILIFIWLISLCVITSYIINFIYKSIIRIIDEKITLVRYQEQSFS